jgi:hypothetical protein
MSHGSRPATTPRRPGPPGPRSPRNHRPSRPARTDPGVLRPGTSPAAKVRPPPSARSTFHRTQPDVPRLSAADHAPPARVTGAPGPAQPPAQPARPDRPGRLRPGTSPAARVCPPPLRRRAPSARIPTSYGSRPPTTPREQGSPRAPGPTQTGPAGPARTDPGVLRPGTSPAAKVRPPPSGAERLPHASRRPTALGNQLRPASRGPEARTATSPAGPPGPTDRPTHRPGPTGPARACCRWAPSQPPGTGHLPGRPRADSGRISTSYGSRPRARPRRSGAPRWRSMRWEWFRRAATGGAGRAADGRHGAAPSPCALREIGGGTRGCWCRPLGCPRVCALVDAGPGLSAVPETVARTADRVGWNTPRQC